MNPDRAGPLPLESPPPFSFTGEASTPSKWWTAFGDAALNEHIERALDENFSLVVAWERLSAAQAIVQREAATLFPALDAISEVTYEYGEGGLRRSGGLELNGSDGAGTGGDGDRGEAEFELGLEANYEVDLWGRIGSRLEAERFRASATLAEYRTAALTLAAEVARTWYQLAEARLQLALVKQQVEANQTVLDLLENRFATGQIRSADVLRQRQLVEATREQAIVVRSRIDVLLNLLAVLCGEPPQVERRPVRPGLPELPPVPAPGLPGELVQRRPDVRRAFLLLEAADRDLAAAVGAQYPRVNLSASISTAAEHPEDLFRQWLASIAGQIVAPLFDGGQRRAEVHRAAAVRRQRIAEYGQAVLEAFREVEDALAQEHHQVARIESMEAQMELARRTYEQLGTQYRSGVTDYIAVLTALIEQQRLERDLLTARLTLLELRIALYRALAGGFETERERDGGREGAPNGEAGNG